MKLTKAERLRIAVGKENDKERGRGVLYKNPSPDRVGDCKSTEEMIADRVNQANRLYNVFFRSNIPRDLEGHFRNLVRIGSQSANVEQFCKKVNGKTYFKEYNPRTRETYPKKLEKFSYKPVGKNLNKVMEQFAKERLTTVWQDGKYQKAAVDVLVCICKGKEVKSGLEELKKSKMKSLRDFLEACRKSGGGNNCFVPATTELEQNFTLLLKAMACIKETSNLSDSELICQQIQWLGTVQELKNSKGETISLKQFQYKYAGEERMQAILVRMRKTLKRGSNRKTAVLLLQGLAQMKDATLKSTVDALCSDEEGRKELEAFIVAVNKDYYKTNVVKSVRGINVKVQPQEDAVLALASVANGKKKTLNAALIDYASSQKQSDRVLREIKRLLFAYFLPGDENVSEEYLTDKKLMQIPDRPEYYFDTDFTPYTTKAKGRSGADMDLESLWGEKPRVKQSSLKTRIGYVNYGKYLRLKAESGEDESRLYWLGYIKEYVERNYVQKETALTREACFATHMLLSCWKEILRFLCGKYIDIGKAVYHFTNLSDRPDKQGGAEYGSLLEQYRDGITSFSYEAIKAEETLNRDISNAVVAAAGAFSRAVIDTEKQLRYSEQEGHEKENVEDVLFLKAEEKDNQLELLMREDAKMRILRFYGGESQVEEAKGLNPRELTKEIRQHLKAVRNESFHYTAGRKETLSHACADKLWENDIRAFRQLVRQRYYANNTGMFYPEDKLKELVEKLYQKDTVMEAQIPAFRTIFKRKDLPQYIRGEDMQCPVLSTEETVIFEGALYFLLKEIYYRDFIVGEQAAKYFFEEVEENVSASKGTEHENAGRNFNEYVGKLKKNGLTFGGVCQYIMSECDQQNRSGQEKEIYKHFKMLLPLCLKNAFWNYVKKQYGYLLKLGFKEIGGEQSFLEQARIGCAGEMQKECAGEEYSWHTFAHFLHPKQLNLLIGDFKSYIQYREDILRRAEYAGQKPDGEQEEKKAAVARAKRILKVLEFVRGVSGRVSNTFTDYYESEEAYARYLSQYIDLPQGNRSYYARLCDLCTNALGNGQVIDLYADEKNPKVIRNIELARMYAGGDICLPQYPKITVEELREYYDKKDEIAAILSKGCCENEDEQEKVVKFQCLKNRLSLNEVTDLYALQNDLFGKLISMIYLHERDEMYLLLGFYYMALRGGARWDKEELSVASDEKYNVTRGLVLQQAAAIFDFGKKMLYYDNGEGKWKLEGGSTSTKLIKFDKNHKSSLKNAIRLFEVEKYDREINDLRNYVEHSKYYMKPDKSILELYGEYYTKFFGYSTKLRKNVLFGLQAVLERYFMETEIGVDKKLHGGIELTKLESMKFTYKLKGGENQGSKPAKKSVQKPARDEQFLSKVRSLLEWKA